jgi:hypothetical protein
MMRAAPAGGFCARSSKPPIKATPHASDNQRTQSGSQSPELVKIPQAISNPPPRKISAIQITIHRSRTIGLSIGSPPNLTNSTCAELSITLDQTFPENASM